MGGSVMEIGSITEKLKEYLREQQKPYDGMLHCSGLAHCAYSQIQQAMGEIKEEGDDLISDVVMYTGTMWHSVLQDALSRGAYDSYSDRLTLPEHDLTKWLPEGWTGSTDGVLLRDREWAIPMDIKTMNGEGMRYIRGVKPEHRWQVSAYRYAISKAIDEWRDKGLQPWDKIKLHPQCVIYYMPVSRAKDYQAEPVEVWFDPLPDDVVANEMVQRATDLEFYKDTGENIASKMKPQITEKRAAGGWKNIYMDNNWWVNYCPAKDCPCKVKAKLIGKRDPGGNVTTNSGAEYTPVDILNMIQRQKDGS